MNMITIFAKIVAYVVVGAVLLLANIVFLSRLKAEFAPRSRSVMLAPIRAVRVGKDAPDGQALAHVVIARSEFIRRELRDATNELTTEKLAPLFWHGGPFSELSDLRELSTLDAKVSFAGVEVSGLFGWLQRNTFRERRVDVTLYDSGTKTTAVIAPADEGVRYITAASEEDAVELVAYSIRLREISAKIPQLAAATPEQLRSITRLLREAADLNRRWSQRTPPTISDYEKLLPHLAAADSNDWAPLLDLAGQIASGAGKPELAATYYRREVNVAVSEADRIRASHWLSTAESAAMPSVEDATATPADAITKLRQILGVSSVAMRGHPRLAIIAPPPREKELTTNSLAAAIVTIAPDTEILWAWDKRIDDRNGAIQGGELLSSLNEAVRLKPDVILISYGPIRVSTDPFRTVFNSITSRNMAIVLGEAPGETERAPNGVVVVSAAREPSAAGTSTVWAPSGPLPVKEGTGTTLRTNRAIATALTASLAVRLRDEFPDASAGDIAKVILTSSRNAEGAAVANLDAARAALKAK